MPEEIKKGNQGWVKDPSRDRRLAVNRSGISTGQGRVKNPECDRRLAVVCGGVSVKARAASKVSTR